MREYEFNRLVEDLKHKGSKKESIRVIIYTNGTFSSYRVNGSFERDVMRKNPARIVTYASRDIDSETLRKRLEAYKPVENNRGRHNVDGAKFE